jgi:predicted outer membrane repeat protein
MNSRIRLLVRALEERTAPAVFTVLNTADSGAGSLRQAILDANAAAGADSIVFDSTFFATAKTILLASSLPVITDPVTINGTTAANCTISGNFYYRVFQINGPGQFDVAINHLSIKSALAFQGAAGISFVDERLAVTDCSITTCTSFGSVSGGAAIGQYFTGTGGTLTVTKCTISGNSSSKGAGVYVNGASSVVLRNDTIASNSGTTGGGIFVGGSGTVLIDSCTISANSASGFGYGGGIYFRSTAASSLLTLRNSTLSGNSAGGNGGGMYAYAQSSTPATTVHIQNSTVTANKASQGGGMGSSKTSNITLSVESSIVSNDTSTFPGTSDFAAQLVIARTSAIGSKSGVTSFTDLGGNIIGAALNLGALANNGGPTFTHALLAGSPCIDKGENAQNLNYDQRGLPRSYGTTDIGAYEYLPPGKPYASGAFADITASTPTISLTVTYADDIGISYDSLGDGDLWITGPNGFLAAATFVSVDNPSDGTPRVVNYSVAGPGGSWDPSDAGLYQVYVEANQVSDTSGNFIPFSQLGAFAVSIPINAVVTNFNDSGPGSLRQAALDTNANPAADSISFNLPSDGTITLNSTLAISDAVTVIGPGASHLTISGGNLVRPFSVDAPTSMAISFSGLTIAQGYVTSSGGGMSITDETVTLTDMVFDSNRATSNGGAIDTEGPLTIIRGQFLNNMAKSTNNNGFPAGGALDIEYTSVGLAISDSYFLGNTAEAKGGAIITNSSATPVTITGSTFANDSAHDGGAMSVLQSSLTVRNCTFSGNTATALGGAIFTNGGWSATITNSTLADNSAATGGGLAANPFARGSLTIASCILANQAATAPDIAGGAVIATVTNSIVRNPTGYADTSNYTNIFGVDPLLAPLADNGGPTPTRLPLPGSPARDRGTNPANLTTDQRGAGYPRLLNGTVDIGAVESIDATGTPTGIVTVAPNVSTTGGTSYQFQVMYQDDVALDATSFDGGDVRVSGPGGFDVPAAFVSVDVAGNGSPRTVTYQITPPGGSWDAGDNGLYFITMQAGAVTDTSANAVPAGGIGGFRVAIARNFVVTTTADSGSGSLRQSILDANANVPAIDTVTFDPAAFASAQTITLTTGELQATDSLNIVGPGANLLTINAGSSSRHFELDSLGPTGSFTFSGMTLTNGKLTSIFDDGSAISDYDDNLSLTNMIFSGNTTQGNGGAVAIHQTGTLTVNGCGFTNNSTTFSGYGGGIYAGSSTTVTIKNSSFVGNSASYQGGGVYANSSASFDTVVFTNNTSSSNGGAINAGTSGSVMLTNCTLTNNTSQARGGAISNFFGIPLNIDRCTLTGNSATSSGGSIYWGGSNVTIHSTTIASNKSGGAGGGAYLYVASSSAILIDASTLSGNATTSAASFNSGGGGLYFGGSSGTSVTLQNTTISGNSTASVGGGIAINFTSPIVNIRNCTITANTASGTNSGGGLARTGTSASTISLYSTIIAGNVGANADLYSAGTITANHCAVGSKTGVTTFTDQGGNLFGQSLMLAPLANNGGLTMTQRLLPGSPCINAGANPGGLTTDQRGVGFNRSVGVTDIGAYEVQAAPKVLSVQINDGSAQRSRVTSLTVTFDSPVILPANPATAFDLRRQSDNAVVSTSANVSGNSVTLTFTGGPIEFGSLADGRYTLTAFASQIGNADAQLDGNGDGVGGDDYVLVGDPATNTLFRLYGDNNGDGTVAASDFIAFRQYFGGYLFGFDFDGDNSVSASDFIQFRLRFGGSI